MPSDLTRIAFVMNSAVRGAPGHSKARACLSPPTILLAFEGWLRDRPFIDAKSPMRSWMPKSRHMDVKSTNRTFEREGNPGQHQPIIDQARWDQVQFQFRANLQAERKRPRTAESSLLTGLLYDSAGNRFTPSHCSKKGLKYRYYLSQAVFHEKNRQNCSGPLRLPAEEIEALVLSQLRALLESPQQLLDLLVAPSATSLEVERSLKSLERTVGSSEIPRKLLRTAVSRIVVHDERVELHLGCAANWISGSSGAR